jgi:2-oxoglutarate dehydrogenase E2 component (dihydrolipoamide succinyltransferase)
VDFGGAREKVEPLTRIRRAIANSMMRSLQTTAQLTAAVEADVTSIMHLRERHKDAFKAENGVSLSPLAMISRVVVDVLSRHPVLNASIDTEAGTVTYHDFINLGIAVDTERGLLVPNIKDAQALDVAAMARSIGDLAARTRERRVTPDDISGGTFTITNTGSRGTLFDTPILNPPEAAILATCAIEKRPVVVEDELGESVAIRWMTYLCLTYDHRLVDGADAARFLSEVKDRLAAVDLSSEVAST